MATEYDKDRQFLKDQNGIYAEIPIWLWLQNLQFLERILKHFAEDDPNIPAPTLARPHILDIPLFKLLRFFRQLDAWTLTGSTYSLQMSCQVICTVSLTQLRVQAARFIQAAESGPRPSSPQAGTDIVAPTGTSPPSGTVLPFPVPVPIIMNYVMQQP